MCTNWLSGMRDHTVISDIDVVPANTEHRVVRRVQFKTSVERLRRRHMKRHQIGEAEARERIPDSVERKVALPFVNIRSLSTQQTFSLFIEHGPLRATPSI